MISLQSFPAMSNAFAVTSSASVESKPPEIPTTAVLEWVCTRRFFSPIAWIIRISSQRFSLSAIFCGTKGVCAKLLVSAVSSTLMWNSTLGRWRSSVVWKVVFFLRSLKRRKMSISLTIISLANRFASFRIVPFSAIILCPPNTTSVVDSPSPAFA